MGEIESYNKLKNKLLADPKICQENKQLFTEFFTFQERKLKRLNSLSELDLSCYKTLKAYACKLRNINNWFNNKPLKDITKQDIQKVYDDLEDGKILSEKGTPFKDTTGYYNKIFKSKLFQMAGKADLAREVIEFTQKKTQDVKFVTEEDFRKIESVIVKPEHKLLAWLAFDYGVNINSLLKLKKSDFRKETNPDTKEPEFHLVLRKEILKRSRRERTLINNYPETFKLLEIILPKLKDDEPVFKIKYGAARKFLDRATKITEVKSKPGNELVTWKDLRSGMTCDLLKKSWSVEELNDRLGHAPSSAVIDAYINFLALDRHKTKRKVYNHNIEQLKDELEASKTREKLNSQRLEKLQEQVSMLLAARQPVNKDISEDELDKFDLETKKLAEQGNLKAVAEMFKQLQILTAKKIIQEKG